MNEVFTAILGGSAGAAVITGVFSLIKWGMDRGASKADKKEDNEDDIKTALRILLYDRIKHLARSYIRKGSITTGDLEDLMMMHKVYHDILNGNGFLDELMEAVKELPIN